MTALVSGWNLYVDIGCGFWKDDLEFYLVDDLVGVEVVDGLNGQGESGAVAFRVEQGLFGGEVVPENSFRILLSNSFPMF